MYNILAQKRKQCHLQPVKHLQDQKEDSLEVDSHAILHSLLISISKSACYQWAEN